MVDILNIAGIGNGINTQVNTNQSQVQLSAKAQGAVDAFEKVIVDIGNKDNQIETGKVAISNIEEQIKSDAQVAKDNLKALFNKLSGAEAVKLDEEGFDLNEIDEEELVTVVDRIKIMLAAYNENYQQFAGAFHIADEDSLEAAGVGNMAAKVAMQLSKGNMPATKENINEVISAADMANDVASGMPLSDETKAYMIENELDLTIGNLYKANHSTINNGYKAKITEDMWQQVKPQVTQIISDAGIETTENVYEDAKWLLENQLPVTAQNITFKAQLDGLTFEYGEEQVISGAIDSMIAGNKASDADITTDYQLWKEAAKAISIVNSAEYEAKVVKNMDSKIMLLEARILMTSRSAVSIVEKGIDVYSEDLENLVELLRQEEAKFINEELTKHNAGQITEEDLAMVSFANDALMALRFAPLATVGQVISNEEITLEVVKEAAVTAKATYDAADERYETMSTKVRNDLGDSIAKAVENSCRGLLEEIGYEVNEINMRAVRILAYNRMTVNEENFLKVRNVDSILNNLMDNMKPQVVYDMICDDINPMETDIETLNKYIVQNYDTTEASVKYSEFLYKLEQDTDLPDEVRERYIGIYKMFHKFKKDDGKAVGALINQDLEVNMKNLVMAVFSRKNYNFDMTVEVDAGMNEANGNASYYNNLFSELSKKISPDSLNDMERDGVNIEELSPENLLELMEQYKNSDKKAKEEYFSQSVEEARKLADVEESVMRLLTDSSQPVTLYNVMAAGQLLAKGSFYNKLTKLDDEDVNRSAEEILSKMDSEENLLESFANLESTVKKAEEKIMETSRTDTYTDINDLKNMSKTVSFINKIAKRQQFFIPFATKDGMGTINLRVQKSGNMEGRLEIKLETEALGNVYASLNVTKESVFGYMVTDGTNSAQLLDSNVDNLKEKLEKLGITSCDISVGISKEIPQVNASNEDNADVPFIYRTAQSVIKHLIGIN